MTDHYYTPRFTATQTMKGVLQFIEQQNWLVERMLLMPKHQVWIKRQVSSARVAATTAIEGVGIGTKAVGELARKQSVSSPDSAEEANINALQAYEFVDYLTDQSDVGISELVIRELNRIFMRGAATTLTPGSYRKGQNQVHGFEPPNQGDVPSLMWAFANWLTAPQADLHPVLRAGLAHLQLVAIHPFWDGNGRTARALMTLILQRSTYGFRNLLSVESSLASMRTEYLEALEKTLGQRFSETYDATPWLEFYVRALSVAASALTSKLTSWHQMMERMHSSFRELGVGDRQADGLAFAIHTGRITRRDYVEITGVSAITASRDLARLVELKVLKPIGRTRDRYYELISSDESHTTPDQTDSQLSMNNGQPPPPKG